MERALILGAGGFLGLNLHAHLTAEGATNGAEQLEVRCGRRRRSNVLTLRRRGADLVLADLDQPESVIEAMRGVDTVFHLAGHYPRLCTDPLGTMSLGLRQLEVALDAASTAGVNRMVFVSSTATVAPPTPPAPTATEADVYTEPPGIGLYHELKWRLERRVLDEDRFEAVVACPGACLGPLDWKVGTSALLVATAHGRCPPHPDGYVNLVDARDVARCLATLGRMPAPPRRVLLVGHTRRAHSLLQMLARRYDAPPPPPPLTAAAAIAFATAEEDRVEGTTERPAIAREIADLIAHAVPVDASLAEEALGATWTPLEDTLDAWDAWARRMGFLPRPLTNIRTPITDSAPRLLRTRLPRPQPRSSPRSAP